MRTDFREIVVVGAGVAGMRAAETLRQDGYNGALTVVGDERHAPYHRPPLSKKLLSGQIQRAGIDLALQFDFDARVLRGACALRLDQSSRTLDLDDDGTPLSLHYDGLVIATGATPRAWPGGAVPDGVMLLRTVDDCLAIRKRLAARPRMVVVGGGFIGGEVAATCRSLGLEVALVERSEGLKQTELAEQLEMQPITLTRLIDKLCDNGWIERRGDENDRRVNRLYLRKAARPLLGKLAGLRSELTATALEGINPADAHRLLAQLDLIKENVRNAIQNPANEPPRKEQRYG